MKKILALLLISIGIFTHQNISAQSCDTLRNYLLSDIFYEISGSYGALLGHDKVNGGTSNILQWAEPYSVNASTEVRRLVFVPWLVHDEGGSVTFNVYQDNAGQPGAVMASETVPLADISEYFQTEIDFTNPVTVNGSFFVGYELEYNTPQDTFAITGTYKSGGTNYTQMFFDGAWNNVDDVYVVGTDPLISAWSLDVLTSNAPAPVADFVSDANSCCLGSSLNLDGSSSQNADQHLWYLTGPGGTPIHDTDEGINAILTPNVSGNDQEIYLIADGGCRTDVLNDTVDVFDPVSTSVSITNSTCGLNNGQINIAPPSGGDGVYSYSIDNGNTFQSSGSFTDLEPGGYNVVVNTSGKGCSYTQAISVSATPQETVSTGPDQTVCAGVPTIITASGVGLIEWYDGGTTVGTGSSISVSPTTTTTYEAILTDVNGCENSDQITVNVNPLPVIDAGLDDAICIGDSYTLTASGGDSYDWDNGLGAGATHVVSPTGTTVYEVIGEDANGCENSDQITIIVNPLPVIDAGTDDAICTGDSYTLIASGGTVYEWDNGLGTGASHVVSPTGTTVYEVIGEDANGCQNSDQITLIVNPLPVIDAGPNEAICIGDSFTLTASGGTLYDWDNSLGAGVSHLVSPTDTTVYTVIGEDANGCENSDQVTIYVNPLPIIDAGPDISICDGSSATIAATGANSYFWDNGLGTGASHNVTPTVTTTYEVIGTDTNNCANIATIEVTVDPIDDPSFTFNDYCEVANSNGPTSIATSGGTFSFNPTPTDGATINASTGEISNGVTGTTYTVEYTTNGPCPSSTTETVTVQTSDDPSFEYDDICLGNGLPIEPSNISTEGGTFEFATVPTDGATIDGSTGVISGATQGNSYDVEYITPSGVCQDSFMVTIDVYIAPTITATGEQTICEQDTVTLNATGGDSYTWDNGLGNGDTQIVTPTSTTTYRVTGSDANGCTNTDDVTVTVNPLPIVDAGNDQVLCEGETVNISASGAISYDWDNGLGAGATHSFTATTTTTYTVTGTGGNNCRNTDEVVVTVNPLPIIDAGADQTICNGDQTTISASGGNTYDWDNGLGAGATHNVSPISTTTYEVIGTDLNNCENTDQVVVTVNENPTINAGVDQEACEGEEVTLSATVSSGTVTWDNGVNDGVPFIATSTTTYTATAEDNGCTASDVLVLTVNPLPVVTMGADLTVCVNHDPLPLAGSPTGGTFAGPGVTGNEFDPGTAGVGVDTITYTYEDGNGCENSAEQVITVDGCVSLDENSIDNSIVVKPNPATDYIDIVVENMKSIQLMTSEGRIINTSLNILNVNTSRIDVSNLSKGTYILRINTENISTSRKVIVH